MVGSVGPPLVPLSTPTTTTGEDEDPMDDDIYYRCSNTHPSVTPTSSDPLPSFQTASSTTTTTTLTILPRQSTSAFNNNVSSSPKKISYDNFTPYLVSVRPSGRKRQSKVGPMSNTPTSFSDSSVTILPPLNIHQQQLHHPSNRKSARKTSGRHHTVPVIVASSSPSKSQSGTASSKRAHSAASNAYIDDPNAMLIPDMILSSRRPQNHRNGAERKHKSGSDKLAKRSQVNKIETVRILRARPAFYPVKDRFSLGKAINKSSIMNEPLSPIQGPILQNLFCCKRRICKLRLKFKLGFKALLR